jgi:hypothetical protein
MQSLAKFWRYRTSNRCFKLQTQFAARPEPCQAPQKSHTHTHTHTLCVCRTPLPPSLEQCSVFLVPRRPTFASQLQSGFNLFSLGSATTESHTTWPSERNQKRGSRLQKSLHLCDAKYINDSQHFLTVKTVALKSCLIITSSPNVSIWDTQINVSCAIKIWL